MLFEGPVYPTLREMRLSLEFVSSEIGVDGLAVVDVMTVSSLNFLNFIRFAQISLLYPAPHTGKFLVFCASLASNLTMKKRGLM